MNSEIKNKGLMLVAVIVAALLFLYPTIKVVSTNLSGGDVNPEEFSDGQWISKPISLGLDLSGGVHLLYRVLADDAVESRLQTVANTVKSDLRKQKIALRRARASDKRHVEITLISSRHLPAVKKFMAEEYKNLTTDFEGLDADGRPQLRYTITDKEIASIKTSAISQAVETLRNRVDQFGVTEPLIQKVGVDRILLQMPGVDDIESIKKVVGKLAQLEFRLVALPGSTAGTVSLPERGTGAPVRVEDSVQMYGEHIDSAAVSVDPKLGRREVTLTFTSEGGKLFGKITGENVGRQLAIILDGEVHTTPVIQERIGGGRCSITGDYSFKEAHELAVVLRAGALPAPLEVLQERTVGPSLGAESIEKGLMAIGISFVLVIAFMIFYYKKSGCVAVGTLILNVLLVVALLSVFGATLTLPGLAGLALTVGMAVDANVIIFERIREELRNGSSRDNSVSAGFDRALSAIIDSNLTTLLAGLILLYFGSGPVRGFAVTLSIGIITTIFCATFVARLAFDFFPLQSKKGLSI